MQKENKIFNIEKIKIPKNNNNPDNFSKLIKRYKRLRPNPFRNMSMRFFNKIININYYISENLSSKTTHFICFFGKCQKTFNNFCRWKQHYETHTNLKPFHCNICNKRFLERGNLNYHMNTHTEKREFYCQFKDCGYRFRTKGNLHRHMKLHQEKEKIRFKKFIPRNKIITQVFNVTCS